MGSLNVRGAIMNSCNYFFAEMGYRMGMDTLREYYAKFGLGSPTGIEIGDTAGRLPSQNEGENLARGRRSVRRIRNTPPSSSQITSRRSAAGVTATPRTF